MPTYDATAFHPPAPLAFVVVRSLTADIAVTEVPMLLDTGADVTLLPRESVAPLFETLQQLPQYELQGFDGARSLAPAIHATMDFLGKSFRGQFLLTEDRTGIIGRNVLNALAIVYDGPSLTWQER